MGRGKGNFEEWKVLFSRKWLEVETLPLSLAYELAVCGSFSAQAKTTLYAACGLRVQCSKIACFGKHGHVGRTWATAYDCFLIINMQN